MTEQVSSAGGGDLVGQGYYNSGSAGSGGLMGNMMQGPMMGADPSMMMMFNQVCETLKHCFKYIRLYILNVICLFKQKPLEPSMDQNTSSQATAETCAPLPFYPWLSA